MFLFTFLVMRSKNKQRVTASEIARQVGVSRPVVSTVLSGGKSTIGVSDALREEIRRVASELGYRPNAAARAMVRQKTQHVGVLIVNSRADPHTAPELYSTILGINFALEQTDYITSLIRIEDVRDAICTGSRALQEEVVDGVIVLGAVPADLREKVEALFRQVVWVDTNVRDEVGCVTRDETGVGVRVGQEIARRGYERAVLLTRTYDLQRSHYSLPHREEGLRMTCEQRGVGFEKLQVDLEDDIRRVRVNSDRVMGFPELVEGYLSEYMQPGVAMVALDETRAGIITRAASYLRRRVGEDFGLVSCDGLTPKMHAVWPDLSRVAYDRYSAGELAAQLMLDALNSGGGAQPSKVLPLKWIEGDTLPSRSSRSTLAHVSGRYQNPHSKG
ncbi:LacI family DNA-binding transcriptional regulator [Phycisphaerales bacterium AB-hyl4]|uniref:LacI family DNA-binding transcriptional regulator n=1 Tax=Natronomicrosphaera hydrolytica TaxID=3242702 RepID=A0ABV4U009_9BACT